MAIVRADILVKGRVQGVGFRAFVREKAQELGVVGWVKNGEKDKVEAVAQGESDQVEELLHNINQGPIGAKVQQVDVTFNDSPSREFNSFEIRR